MDINKPTKSWEELGSNIRVEIGSQGTLELQHNPATPTKMVEGRGTSMSHEHPVVGWVRGGCPNLKL